MILRWLELLDRRKQISNLRQTDSMVAHVIPASWNSCPSSDFPPLSMIRICDFWLGRVWQRWQAMHDYEWVITLEEVIPPILLGLSDSVPCWLWREAMRCFFTRGFTGRCDTGVRAGEPGRREEGPQEPRLCAWDCGAGGGRIPAAWGPAELPS